MNKTFEVVKAWAAFEEKYPEGTIEDFCRHYLTAENEKEDIGDEVLCDDCNNRFDLSRIINQLSRLWMHFTQIAIRPFDVSNFDEFVFLYTVDAVKEIRKKDLIYMHFIEMSSGLLIIDRLIKKEMLKETVHAKDKRSKLLTITQKGQKVLKESRLTLDKVAEDMYGGMPQNDMLLCTKLLSLLQKKNAQRWHQSKNFEPFISESF
ncbi:MAG: MarR family transcriptional regulator [Chitinophagaceae bacterium]